MTPRAHRVSDSDQDSTEVRPYGRFGALITGHPVGAVLAVGVMILLLISVPQSRLFVLGTVVLGSLIGLALWLKRR